MTRISELNRERGFFIISPALVIVSLVIARWDTLSVTIFNFHASIIIAGFLILGLVTGATLAFLHKTPGFRKIEIFKLFILTIFILFGLDISFKGEIFVTDFITFTPDMAFRYNAILFFLIFSFGVIVFACLWIVRKSVANIFLLYSITFFAITFVKAIDINNIGDVPVSSIEDTIQYTPPPVIYVVMDELMGVEGLSSAPQPGGKNLANKMREAFLSRGFRVYGKAFSRYAMSTMSIGTAINFAPNDNRAIDVYRDTIHGLFEEPRLFKNMAEDNRSIHVFNGSNDNRFNFCKSDNITACETFKLLRPMSEALEISGLNALQFYWDILDIPGTFTSKIRRFIFSKSILLKVGIRYIGFHDWMANISQYIISLKESNFVFIHILLPHSPYILNSECKIRNLEHLETTEDPYNLTQKYKLTGREFNEKRELNYSLYFPQAECAIKEVVRFIDILDDSPQFLNATIIITGDHGSRISAGHRWIAADKKFEQFSTQDLIDNHSAMFAIRGPEIVPEYDLRHTSIQRLTAEYLGNMNKLDNDDKSIVILSSPNEIKVIPMPDFGESTN